MREAAELSSGRENLPAGNVPEPQKDRGECKALINPGGQTQLEKWVNGTKKPKITRKQLKLKSREP